MSDGCLEPLSPSTRHGAMLSWFIFDIKANLFFFNSCGWTAKCCHPWWVKSITAGGIDPKMSKRRSTKSNRKKDAIAYRTRQRLGSVMRKTQPVQHPHCWPLLRELEMAKAKRCRSAFPSPAGSCPRRRLPRRTGKKTNFPSVIQRKTYRRETNRTRRAQPRKQGRLTRRAQHRKRGRSTRRKKSKYARTKRYRNKQGRLKPKSSARRRSRHGRNNKSRPRIKQYIRRKGAQGRASRRNPIKRKWTATH